MPNRLVVATHNPGKLAEFRNLLAPYVDAVTSAGELGLPEPEETGDTFAANALLKAEAAAKALRDKGAGGLVLADDSGLCVNALGGQPGIYSARWGGPQKDMAIAMRRVQDGLGDAADRSASFVCVLALAFADGRTATVEGRCDGTIIWPPRGTQGHGYDPVFVPAGETRTFAEMSPAEKDALSHRGRAFGALVQRFF